MVENHCEIIGEDGTRCGCKAYQILVDWNFQKAKSVCKKHRFNLNAVEGLEVINLSKFKEKKE